jgi:hypothetical protein
MQKDCRAGKSNENHQGEIMTARATLMGHEIVCNDGKTWVYADTGESIANVRGDNVGLDAEDSEQVDGPQFCKDRGYTGVRQVAELLNINYGTFQNWPKTRPMLFKAAVIGLGYLSNKRK